MPITLNFTMRKLIQTGLSISLSFLLTGGVAYAMQPPEKLTVAANQAPNTVVQSKVEQEPVSNIEQAPAALETVAPKETEVKPVETSLAIPKDNETIIWEFLAGQGYTRNQVAGIMGNLQQEHNFKTDDVPGGLGIAQWIGGRRSNLVARGNYLDINVQLQFLVDELNGPESRAKTAILASDSVESSTMAFSSLFERCGTCHNDKRIQYAYQILGRH